MANKKKKNEKENTKVREKPRKIGQEENLLPKITKRFEGVGRARNFSLVLWLLNNKTEKTTTTSSTISNFCRTN